MTKAKWSLISSIIALIYAAFLQMEAYLPAWRPLQLSHGHDIAESVAGVVIFVWVMYFYRLKK